MWRASPLRRARRWAMPAPSFRVLPVRPRRRRRLWKRWASRSARPPARPLSWRASSSRNRSTLRRTAPPRGPYGSRGGAVAVSRPFDTATATAERAGDLDGGRGENEHEDEAEEDQDRTEIGRA